MEIRFFFGFYFSLFIILNVSELNATVRQQRNVEKVCGKPSQATEFMIHGKESKRGEFPWTVALFNKLNSPAEFFGAGTLISKQHVVTGKNQMENANKISSFDDNLGRCKSKLLF